MANTILAEVAKHSAEWVDGYVTDATLTGIANNLDKRTITTPEGSRKGNNKWLLHKHIEERGLRMCPRKSRRLWMRSRAAWRHCGSGVSGRRC